MIIEAFGASHEGQSTLCCEKHFIDQELGLHLITGGSGFKNPDMLAQTGSRAIVDFLKAHKEELSSAEKSADWPAIKRLAENAILAANQALFEHTASADSVATFAMVLIRGTKAFIANIGDEAIYLLRHGKVTLLSRSTVIESQNTQSQVRITTSWLRIEDLKPEVVTINVLPGDKLLIASKRTLAPFRELKELAMLLSSPADNALQRLVKQAAQKESNASLAAVVIEVKEPQAMAEAEKEQIETNLAASHAVEISKLFQGLSSIERAQVLELCAVKKAKAGELIITSGDMSTDLYIILSGLVLVVRKGVPLAQYGEGEYVGEGAFLCGPPRNADVKAVSDCRYLALPRNPFAEFTKDEPIIGMKMLTEMAKELINRLEAAWDK